MHLGARAACAAAQSGSSGRRPSSSATHKTSLPTYKRKRMVIFTSGMQPNSSKTQGTQPQNTKIRRALPPLYQDLSRVTTGIHALCHHRRLSPVEPMQAKILAPLGLHHQSSGARRATAQHRAPWLLAATTREPSRATERERTAVPTSGTSSQLHALAVRSHTRMLPCWSPAHAHATCPRQ